MVYILVMKESEGSQKFPALFGLALANYCYTTGMYRYMREVTTHYDLQCTMIQHCLVYANRHCCTWSNQYLVWLIVEYDKISVAHIEP